jgi:hypothetical protein
MDDDFLNSTEHGTYDPDGNPITYGEWMNLFKQRTARQMFRQSDKHHLISTVFLGLDHGMRLTDDPNYRPLIYETMIFCYDTPTCDLDGHTQRYTTRDEARAGHTRALELVRLETQLP